MRKRTILLCVAAALAVIGITAAQGPAAAPATPAAATPAVAAGQAIDLVICLDTSNSMDALIESAKIKLWAVVNELANAKPTPNLRVGLYQYGNDGLKPETGWVDKRLDLTTDLDEVYKQLFTLKTNGGTEYVARVVTAAREQIQWSADPKTLKVIFVCGNEPATQDKEITLEQACKATVAKDIIVNSIYCGQPGTAEAATWQQVATLSDGQYAAIDQAAGTVAVTTPFDSELTKLSGELNKTYVAYGAEGGARQANQAAQDANAAGLGAPAAAQRAQAKAGAMYRNSAWDLVDASKEKGFDLAKIPTEQLPEEMRKMTPEERKAYLEKKVAERAELQKKVAELGQKRDEYVKNEIAKQKIDDTKGLDYALRNTVRQQAEKKGFQFPEAPKPEDKPK